MQSCLYVYIYCLSLFFQADLLDDYSEPTDKVNPPTDDYSEPYETNKLFKGKPNPFIFFSSLAVSITTYYMYSVIYKTATICV